MMRVVDLDFRSRRGNNLRVICRTLARSFHGGGCGVGRDILSIGHDQKLGVVVRGLEPLR